MTAKNEIMENEEKEVVTGLPEQNVIEQTEEQLIEGLLFAAEAKYSDDEQKVINIKRNGKVAFSLRIRPLSEDELIRIRKSSTPTYANPSNKKLRIEGELRYGEFRSKKIYEATVEEKSGHKIWDNPNLKAKLNAKGYDIIESWEIIDKVLLAGEKDAVSDLIDNISGYEVDLTEYAKN